MGKNLNIVERILFFVAALMFILPGSMFDIGGLALGVVLVLWCLIYSKRHKQVAA